MKPSSLLGSVGTSLLLIAVLSPACGGSVTDAHGTGAGGATTGTGTHSVAGAGGSVATSGSGGGPSDAGFDGAPTAKQCFAGIENGPFVVNYDKFHPVINATCSGTKNQDIKGIERIVFLGDSITTGTPPTPQNQFYANVLNAKLQAKFGAIPMENCSAWGATTSDFLANGNQIQKCFPSGVEKKKTLIIMTMGGNDIAAWAKAHLGTDAALKNLDGTLANMRDAVTWLKDPMHFPNGSDVVFANVYEFTDLTTDLSSCPTAQFVGFMGKWLEGAAVVIHMEEQYMKIAMDTKSDMIFLEETFCGHGFHASDKTGQCYRGPNAATWFDISCIHPTPVGHAEIADLFSKTIDG